MNDGFKEFLDAEVYEIFNSMDEVCRQDPELCRKMAFEWIEKNADVFRAQWFAKKEIEKEYEKARMV